MIHRWQILKPVVVKELRQVRRDPTALGMLLLLPAAIIGLVGYALNFDVKHIPLGTVDQDRTAMSREFLDGFMHSEYFDFRGDLENYSRAERAIMHGDVRMVLVVPPDFSQNLTRQSDVKVQIIVDGADNNTALQAVGYANRIISNFSSEIGVQALSSPAIDLHPRIWYNPDLITSKFLVPGLIGFILMITAVVSTSLTVVREKERGTMEQIMVSPLKPAHVIIGKTIPYLFISLVAATVILFLGYLLFAIEIRGSLVVLYAAILLFILGALGQGLLISSITDSQQVAFMISVFSSLLPTFLLSGFIFPVESMPLPLQIISNIAVTKFFLVVVRSVMLKGAGIEAVWGQFAAMAAFALITITVSSKRLRKRTI